MGIAVRHVTQHILDAQRFFHSLQDLPRIEVEKAEQSANDFCVWYCISVLMPTAWWHESRGGDKRDISGLRNHKNVSDTRDFIREILGPYFGNSSN